MAFFLTKIFVSALVIAIVTEVAKLSDKWGGLIAALPTMTFLILLWMHFEGASDGKVARHVGFTIYFLLPTLPLFSRCLSSSVNSVFGRLFSQAFC